MRRIASLLAAVAAAILVFAPAAGADTRPDLVLTAGETLTVSFDQPPGRVSCPDVPVVVTSGPVSLGDATLDLATTVPPGAGFGCLLIDNRGPDPVAGSFAGLPEGTVFGPPSARFRITYAGGDGNDVRLKRVEVPSLIALGGVPIYAGGWYTEHPSTLHVYVGGDTPTTLAAPGTVTVTLDGATVGAFPLEHSSVDVPLGVIPIGEHVIDVSYGGGDHGGDRVFLPATASMAFTIRQSHGAPPVLGPDGQPAPGGVATPPGPVPTEPPPPPPPSPAAPTPGTAAPDEPAASKIRAALRRVDRASLSRRSVSFVQTISAAGTVRWRILARTRGEHRTLVTRTRTVNPGLVKARLALGARARKMLRRTPAARVVLETTLATRAGRQVTARARLR